MSDSRPTLRVLGIRGLPAAHGGFETFAAELAPWLVGRGWRVVVYCQEDGEGPVVYDQWHGIERVRIPVLTGGAAGTVVFDWRAVRHAAAQGDLCLTLGYNTAVFCAWLRLRGVPNVINMDGIEWARAKWGPVARAWFRINELAGCWLGDHLVADHPQIQAHLAARAPARRITMIPYGAPHVAEASVEPLESLCLQPQQYLTLIARPEPENSVLEVVQAFSRRPRGVQLVVLGAYSEANPYHVKVRAVASGEVRFVGAIYQADVLRALRVHCLAYVHGHRVGGTNPSLVEALGAGNAVLAHDNRFNRWVAGEAARYFADSEALDTLLTRWLADPKAAQTMRQASRLRHAQAFTWPQVLAQYEELLVRHLPPAQRERHQAATATSLLQG